MNHRDRIALDLAIRFGKPCIRGTRIAVGNIPSYLASGMREDEILADFPQLTPTISARALPTPRNTSAGLVSTVNAATTSRRFSAMKTPVSFPWRN